MHFSAKSETSVCWCTGETEGRLAESRFVPLVSIKTTKEGQMLKKLIYIFVKCLGSN